MKRKILSIVITLGLLVGLIVMPAQAALPEDIELSIEKGLEWLVPLQQPDGSWGPWERVATTAFAVVKLEDRAYELGYDSPFDPEYEYSENVISGLDYILEYAYEHPAGGAAFSSYFDPLEAPPFPHETYTTGVVMMALAASQDPTHVATTGELTGWTYQAILQANVDFFVASQNADGGWRYFATNDPSDNSNTGFAVLGLSYAENFGIPIPLTLKDNLSSYIDYIQSDTTGASGYTAPGNWENVMKTGNLLFEMTFVGDASDSTRMLAAIDYIEEYWDHQSQDPGWYGDPLLNMKPSYLSMYCLMKGFEIAGIDTITVVRGGNPIEVDWFDEVSTRIVDTQEDDGSWLGGNWGNQELDTVWALLTLERIAPPPSDIPVPIDIKPTSCPNPLNVKGKGVMPAAILGTEDFDVSEIDPASVRLINAALDEPVEVAPLRWAYEDVAAPYPGGFSDPLDREDCWTEGPDGFMDLTLKFDAQEIVAAIGAVDDGDVIVLTLTGNLTEDAGGTAIIGQDIVWIKNKGK
ncbi:MAG TPA: terpene cyclase/mutase family protein [Dehalococcoidia bacterium]|nr:terpene cyclase/mutase family protein [Dehalococcoidia bacterium]